MFGTGSSWAERAQDDNGRNPNLEEWIAANKCGIKELQKRTFIHENCWTWANRPMEARALFQKSVLSTWQALVTFDKMQMEFWTKPIKDQFTCWGGEGDEKGSGSCVILGFGMRFYRWHRRPQYCRLEAATKRMIKNMAPATFPLSSLSGGLFFFFMITLHGWMCDRAVSLLLTALFRCAR